MLEKDVLNMVENVSKTNFILRMDLKRFINKELESIYRKNLIDIFNNNEYIKIIRKQTEIKNKINNFEKSPYRYFNNLFACLSGVALLFFIPGLIAFYENSSHDLYEYLFLSPFFYLLSIFPYFLHTKFKFKKYLILDSEYTSIYRSLIESYRKDKNNLRKKIISIINLIENSKFENSKKDIIHYISKNNDFYDDYFFPYSQENLFLIKNKKILIN